MKKRNLHGSNSGLAIWFFAWNVSIGAMLEWGVPVIGANGPGGPKAWIVK